MQNSLTARGFTNNRWSRKPPGLICFLPRPFASSWTIHRNNKAVSLETRGFSWKQGRARSTNHQIVFLSIKIFAAELRILTCRLISETRLAVALIMTFHLASLFSFPRVCAGKRFARRVNGKHKDKLSSQRIYGEDREGEKK